MGSLFRRGPRGHEYFIANGFVCLLAASIWILTEPSLFQQYFYFGRLLALTHLITLGVVSSFIMGVLFRLTPVLLGVAVEFSWTATLQLAFFLIGSHGLIAHFWLAEWTGMSWSAGMLWGASLLQLWNFRGLYRGGRKNSWARRFVAASIAYFVLAASLGFAISVAKAYGARLDLLSDRYLANVFAHAHLAGLGWVGSMILGFQLVLVPATGRARWSIPWRFALWNGGLIVLIAAWLVDPDPGTLRLSLTLGAAAVALSIVGQAAGPARGLSSARTREWESLPLFSLVALSLVGVLLAVGWPDESTPLRARVQLAYGFVALVGFMLLSIVATGFKLFPMWVWKERFQPEFGKRPVPGMKELHSETLRAAANLLLFLGALVGAGAIALGSDAAIRAATILVGLGIFAFSWNLVLVLRWSIFMKPYHPTEDDEAKFRDMFRARE